ncbi:hypothetical protein FA048_14735 [Pedobacter polaris]|uniref:Uncharacterized protein n=1 Tax=Pedobacter polaris TaxID=2571273 RepID=A0A4U1CIE3_9SPHI|nr:hypothetical protein [Pedobacter polaris]TKC06470.1 hypothetical protein FA048_14735 [Pedobacter polaris]
MHAEVPLNNIIKIDYTTVEWLKKIALKNLGLDNINKLRDRFEGQLYLDNFLKRSFLEIAFEKYTGIKFIDKLKKETYKNYVPSFIINKQTISLFSFTNGEYPKISTEEFDFAVFGMVNLEARQTELIGFLHKKEVVKYTYSDSLSPLTSRNYLGMFKTFDKILPINKLSL